MRIALLNLPSEFYSPVSGGAIATVIMQHAAELIRRGHDVSVLTGVDDEAVYPVGRVFSWRGATKFNLNWVQRRLTELRRRVTQWDWEFYEYHLAGCRRALAELRPAPEVVIVHNDLMAPWYLRRLLPEARIVLWLHNEQVSHWPRAAEALREVDQFVTVSEYLREWTMRTHGLTADQVTTILNGVDLEQFTPAAERESGAGPVRVFCLGRIDPNKGADLAADAVATLQREGVAVSFSVAGPQWWHGGAWEDPYFVELKAKLAGVGGEYLGHVARAALPALLRQQDVVCVLSRSQEPFGLVALEAMASGCAVVASRRGGLPEACDGAAQLVNPDEPEEIAAALRTLATQPAALTASKQRGVERARRAAWTHAVDALEAIMGEELAVA